MTISLSQNRTKILKQSIEVISRNFSDEDYDQNTLSKDLTISRTQLYRKMKKINRYDAGRLYPHLSHENRQKGCSFSPTIPFLKSLLHVDSEPGILLQEIYGIHNCSRKDFYEQKEK